ncbi:Kinase, NEK [Giardia muris]|uniref:non-specific serine/threonine protein kinase n=1 Tax=Giardia muris TaxID=5742 RepID=A0A4Z1T1G7_GIAMU|nr:Kinase, NEK [Giardia muris]|eukprot:TNJ27763.1 Kinase, NEK [Giardia muris]
MYPGLELYRYRIEELLGSGSGGTVYAARYLATGEPVAMKHLTRVEAIQQQGLKLLPLLRHPAIIRVLGIHQDVHGAYVFMERGDISLEKLQRTNPFFFRREAHVLQAMADVALGLEYLHDPHKLWVGGARPEQAKVIHRDITLSNLIMVGSTTKIADFDISRQLQAGFLAKTCAGTALNAAPELLFPDAGEGYDEKVDVWALGCCIYELCMGYHLFRRHPDGPTSIRSVQAQVREFAPDALKLPGYSTDLLELLQKMLCVSPEARISAKDIVESSPLRPYVLKRRQEWISANVSTDYRAEPTCLPQYSEYRTLRDAIGVKVYVGVHKDTGQQEVIKAIELAPLKTRTRQRQELELRLAGALRHPRLVENLGIERTHASDDLQLGNIIQRYYRHGSLETFCSRFSHCRVHLPEALLWHFLRCGLDALAFLHSPTTKPKDLGVVIHNDVKPGNLLVTDEYGLVLGDFGSAVCVSESVPDSTEYGGTLIFAAPEILEGRPYGPQADVWSLGITLAYAASLHLVVYGSTRQAVLQRAQEYAKEVHLPEIYSNDFKSFLKRLLTIDPDRRPKASDLLSRLGTMDIPSAKGIGGTLPIYSAIDTGSPLPEPVLDAIKEADPYDDKGMFALGYAAKVGNLAVIDQLLESQKHLRTVRRGLTALMIAVLSRQHSCIERLLPCAGQQDSTGMTALMWAVQLEDPIAIRLLTRELGITRPSGGTALMLAAARPGIDVEPLLAEAGMRKDDGTTALIIAASVNNIEAAKQLVGREAGMVTAKGFSALAYAIEYGHADIQRLLTM